MPLTRLVLVGVLGIFTPLIVAKPALAHIIAFTVNEVVDLAPGGLQMAVTGTVQCIVGESASISVSVAQDRGQQTAMASGGLREITCTGTPQEWGVTATSSTPFKKGPAGALGSAFTFGADGFDSATAPARVRLQ